MQQNRLRRAALHRQAIAALRAAVTALLFAATVVASSGAPAAEASPAASAFIQGLGDDAIKQLTDPALPRPERESRFRRLLDENFDMAGLSKFVLGRYYRAIDDARRAEFQRLFVDFLVGAYADRFGAYMGDGLKVMGSSAEDGGLVLVQSKINMRAAKAIRVDWRLRPADGRFAIVDLVVEGVSMGQAERSAFAAQIESGGVDGLMAALRTKRLPSADSIPQ